MKLLDLDCKLFKIYFSIYNSPIKKWVKKSSFLKGLLLSTLVVNNCFGVVCMQSARGLSSEKRFNFLRLHMFQLFMVPSIADFSKECYVYGRPCWWQVWICYCSMLWSVAKERVFYIFSVVETCAGAVGIVWVT